MKNAKLKSKVGSKPMQAVYEVVIERPSIKGAHKSRSIKIKGDVLKLIIKNLPATEQHHAWGVWSDIAKKADELAPNLEQTIRQIKGKQNQKPKDEYIPYVQDFVKSQNWGHVSDIKNANMERIEYMFYPNQIEELKSKGFDVPKYITQDELDNYLANLLKE
mgnify:CR=1 FL=1